MDIMFSSDKAGVSFALAGADLKSDAGIYTAICLSLFNGDCFYNIYTKNKTDNSFVEALFAPINVKNLSNAQTKAENLLKWLVEIGVAASVDVFAYGNKNGKINVDITITEPDSKTNKYSVLWDSEKIYLKDNKNYG